jgi:hypothetical protein
MTKKLSALESLLATPDNSGPRCKTCQRKAEDREFAKAVDKVVEALRAKTFRSSQSRVWEFLVANYDFEPSVSSWRVHLRRCEGIAK